MLSTLAAASPGAQDIVQYFIAITALVAALTAVIKGRSEKDAADKSDWREGTKNFVAMMQTNVQDCQRRCEELAEENARLSDRVSKLEQEKIGLQREIAELRGNQP